MATPDTFLQTAGLAEVLAPNVLVTPTGGTQGKLGDLLAATGGGSGPIAATTLSASGAVGLSPANANVTISPSGTGEVVINPATAGTMDNIVIGATTPVAAHATTLSATGAATFSNAVLILSAIPTADPHVVGHVWANAGVLTISAG